MEIEIDNILNGFYDMREGVYKTIDGYAVVKHSERYPYFVECEQYLMWGRSCEPESFQEMQYKFVGKYKTDKELAEVLYKELCIGDVLGGLI